jgi:nucleotide-binding universal stress UspA family protein
MFNEILACLDGSPLAESILPLARGLAGAARARLILLRVVVDSDEMATEENYLSDCARRYGAQLKFLIAADPGQAIVAELEQSPGAIAAMTTHGRTALVEALIGSVALKVIQNARRPIIIYRSLATHQNAPSHIGTIAVALDGGEFSERIIPPAVELAKAIDAKLMLIQVIPAEFSKSTAPNIPRGDFLESSYLHAKAAAIREQYGIEPSWDVLHGEPGDAISRYVRGMAETLLAMTSHARSGLERAILGSVAADCIRHCGVPMLIHWPHV